MERMWSEAFSANGRYLIAPSLRGFSEGQQETMGYSVSWPADAQDF